jgi:hypothetical protein
MPLKFDKENYQDNIKSLCKGLFEESAKDKKQCIDRALDCYINKCKKEVEDKEISQLTDEEKTKCSEKFKDDFKKKMKCHKKILQKNDFYEKNAKEGYCSANKCPEMTELLSNGMQNIINQIYESDPKYKCVEEHCKKEHEETTKINIGKIIEHCNKKYSNHKGQSKCASKMMLLHNKVFKNYNNCKDTKCNIDNKQNTKNTKNTKKSNTKKSNTKKSKSHTKKSKKH